MRLPRVAPSNATTLAELTGRIDMRVSLSSKGSSKSINHRPLVEMDSRVAVGSASGTALIQDDIRGFLPIGGSVAGMAPPVLNLQAVGSASVTITVNQLTYPTPGAAGVKLTWTRKGKIEVHLRVLLQLTGGLEGFKVAVLSSSEAYGAEDLKDWNGGSEQAPYPSGFRPTYPDLDPPNVSINREDFAWERGVVRGKIRSRLRRVV